jgi:triacylglycerol lipase
METINGINFEDWACGCANLAAGMPEDEMIKVLGIELPVWVETCDKWSAKLGDMMTEDMSIATKYGEYFTNPKQGKFANVGSHTMSLEDTLTIVPDFDAYQKIFWQMSQGAEVGIDGVKVLQENGLTLQSWSSVGQHYNQMQHQMMDENLSPEELNSNYNFLNNTSDKWRIHWENHYKDSKVDLAGDINF